MKAVVENHNQAMNFLTKACRVLGEKFDRPQVITIDKVKSVRSLEQNSYLWGVCYKTILAEAGEQLAGWTREDLHEYYKGECFGWETLEGFGRKRMKPVHGSKKLTKMEFVDFVAFIQQKAAEMGIVIPDPERESDENA